MNRHDAAKTKSRLAGRRVIASISGGKDSAAMSLYLSELGIDHDRVFMDTGWEHPDVYAYLRGPLAAKIGPITEIRSEKHPGGMADLVRKKGMFASRTRRFCTQELKVYPMQRYIAAQPDDVVNTVGIRHGESRARSKMPEWEWSDGFDCEVWRPLVAWSEQDVIDIHTRNGLAPCPLYLRGASRVGCWPCIFARKSEIVFLADTDPARIDFIRDLERDVQAAAAARYARMGEDFESRGFNPPTFFQAMGGLRSEPAPCGCGKGVCRLCLDGRDDCEHCGGTRRCDGSRMLVRDGRMVPIDEVVAWARTGKGGRQYEMFAPEGEAGCVRWGLCDTGAGVGAHGCRRDGEDSG